MSDLSRRDLLRASAGAAAIAVPMSALSGRTGIASATTGSAGVAAATEETEATSGELERFGRGPVMFCVHDAMKGEVSILHGKREVVVKDRRLVAQILRAARSRGR
jgi:hypothetical protein